MNQVDKFIKKLEPKQKEKILSTLILINQRNWDTLDIKLLKGFKSIYRVRVGRYRIIFEDFGKHIDLIKIDDRNDNTYNL